MKIWILLVFFLLGTVTYEVGGDEESGEEEFPSDAELDDIIENLFLDEIDDDDDDDDGIAADDDDDDNKSTSGEDDDDNEGEEKEEEEEETDCGNFNLEICIHEYYMLEEYSPLDTDEALCWESYITMECLHDYASDCFPDSKVKEDYLCKIKQFQDRIQLLCLNDTGYENDNDEAKLDEVLECLEGAETDAEECVETAIPEIMNMLKEKDKEPNVDALDEVKCLIMESVLECLANRVQERCKDEEVTEAFKEGAREGMKEVLGGICEDVTITDVVSLK